MARPKNRPATGRYVDPAGYVRVICHGHPRAYRDGYVLEHILKAEHALGKALPPAAIVHHHDEIKHHNENSNLVICQDNAYHRTIHARMRVLASGHSPHLYQICWRCGPKLISEFGRNRANYTGVNFTCRSCVNDLNRDRRKAKRRAIAA